MQRLQIIERAARGLDDVAPAVIPPVLLQAEARAGFRNELPQSRGARARIGVGLKRAFHHGQQRDLERHAARFEFSDDMVKVQLRAAEGALQILGIGGEPVQLLVDAMLFRVIFELEARAHAIEKVRVLRRGKARDLCGLFRGAEGSTTSGDWAEGGMGAWG